MSEVPADAVDVLRGRGFRGELLTPGSDGYDARRRVWNGLIDRSPGLIARCADVTDVVSAVTYAREHGLHPAVRGGGHNVAGKATLDDGLQIDLSALRGVHVDPSLSTAWAQGGATWADVDRATQVYGLATTGGAISTTGIAGLTLGGGFGILMRRCGLTCDNLIGAEVVTAEGAVVRASAEQHPDLLWALRGGGGNFGVVTGFQYRLHSVGPEILAGVLLHPLHRLAEVLRLVRAFAETAPEPVACGCIVATAPDLDDIPSEIRGKPCVMVLLTYSGDPEEGERVLASVRDFGPPTVDGVLRTRYAAFQCAYDAQFPSGRRYYLKSGFLPSLDDDVIATIVAHAVDAPSPATMVEFLALGGAVAREPDGGSLFGARDMPYIFNIISGWDDPADDDANVAWSRALFQRLEPHATGGVYQNYVSEESDERVAAGFGAAHYERLVEVKATWDPANLFRHNHNVAPAPMPAI